MIATSTASANSFLKNLTWYESKDIKKRYQDRSLFEKIKDQNITNPLNEFLEYEVSKHIDFIEQQKAKVLNNKPVIKEFMNQKELLPLYMHSKKGKMRIGLLISRDRYSSIIDVCTRRKQCHNNKHTRKEDFDEFTRMHFLERETGETIGRTKK